VFKAITSKPLYINIIIGLLLAAVIVLGVFASLGFVTGHNNYKKVPAIIGQNVYAATSLLEAEGFKVIISDSVFTTDVPGLTVTKQIPEADAEVKKGRTIYLSINRSVPPLIDMPSLVGFSFRSAELYLQSLGLKLGDTTYKPDFAKNAVLEQLINGTTLKPGAKVPLGTAIDFVLGSGVGSTEMNVPNLIGLTLTQAKSILETYNLNIGTIVPTGTIADTANSFIIRQNPEVFSEPLPGQKTINKIRPGTIVDLYISATAPVMDTAQIVNP
jgi:eukaryotic-like serine/threonine-protein kinase